MVKVETEAPALGRKPSATATPSTLDKRASPRLYRFEGRWEGGQGSTEAGVRAVPLGRSKRSLRGGSAKWLGGLPEGPPR